MKAAVFAGPKNIKIKEVDNPIIDDDDVLVRVKYCGICGTDVASYLGVMPHISTGEQKYPFIPGHEWSGEIVEAGKNVKKFEIGDRVTGDVSIGCGKCIECLKGNYNLCEDRLEVGNFRNKNGAMAQYIAMPERHVYRLPEAISFIEGAITEPLATALYAFKRIKTGIANHVLVTGTGLIGILAAQVAQLNRASTVILTGRTARKLDIARQCGIKNTVNVSDSDLDLYIKDLKIPAIDFCIECSGNAAALRQCIESVKPGGDISIIGFYETEEERLNIDGITTKDLEVHGILASPNTFKSALDLMSKSLINYNPLITKIFSLDNTESAIKFILDRKNNAIKVMLEAS